MKYSARLVTALAAVALLVAVLVALGNSTRNAYAASDGKVYLTNKWSTLTTESSPPSGRTFVGSGSTLYSTFVERTSAGLAQNTIETNSNVVIVTVVDADADLKSTATSTVTWTSATTTNTIQTAALPFASSPVVDSTGNGVVDGLDVTPTVTGTGQVSVSLLTAGTGDTNGNGTQDSGETAAVVQLIVSTSGTITSVDLSWKTSARNTVSVKITSTNDLTGITLTATETGLTTARFEVEVTLIDADDATQSSTTTAPAKIKILHGGTLTATYTDTTPVTGTSVDAKGTLVADTSAPVITVTSPANKSATQNRRPVFSGTLADTGGAGLKVSSNTTKIYVDKDTSAGTDTTRVDLALDSVFNASIPTGTADGVTTSSFTFTPSVDLPEAIAAAEKPNTDTDWQVRSTDNAGNVGFSDSDSATANDDNTSATPGRGQSNVVRIDQVLPVLKAAVTGFAWDTTLTTPARKAGVNTSIEVVFDGPIDSATVVNTDFEASIGGTTQVPTAAQVFSGQTNSVFLTFGTAIPANDKPVVKLATGGSLSDTAGNNLTTGSITAVDGLAPTLTVTLSGGSSASSPSTLTKSTIDVTVTADETLSVITIKVYTAGSVLEQTLNVVPQGGNVFKATTSAAGAEGKRSVVVTASDAATVVGVDLNQDGDTADGTDPTDETIGVNARTAGDADTTSTKALVYTYDPTAPALTITPADASTTDELRPFVILDWGEAIATINKATFDGTDVSASLSASSDRKKWIYKPTADLTLAKHTVVAQATDDAGNKSAELTKAFTVAARAAFSLPLNPGWNLVSLRSEPADTSINSVITVKDISTVITYDPTATGGPWLVATRGTDGKLAGSLTTIDGMHGYWINTTSFEAIKVLDPKPTGGSLPPAIPVSAGWNLVPARDITGSLAAAAVIAPSSTYFNGTKITRAYKFDTLTGKFVQLVLTGTTPTDIKVGEAYWAYFTEAGAVVP